MRGPPKKPTNLRIIQGNPSKRPLPKDEPMPPEAPAQDAEPPQNLNAMAREEWRVMLARLRPLGLFTTLDRQMLAGYCIHWARAAQADLDIEALAARDAATHGMVIKTTKGNMIQNPLVGVSNSCWAMAERFAAKFGMSPSDRTRLQVQVASPLSPASPNGAPTGTDRFFAR